LGHLARTFCSFLLCKIKKSFPEQSKESSLTLKENKEKKNTSLLFCVSTLKSHLARVLIKAVESALPLNQRSAFRLHDAVEFIRPLFYHSFISLSLSSKTLWLSLSRFRLLIFWHRLPRTLSLSHSLLSC
jgi:hypothetical protein